MHGTTVNGTTTNGSTMNATMMNGSMTNGKTTNGVHKPSITKTGQPTAAWRALAQCLPSRSPDIDYWWQLTGKHLAALVEAADYPMESQYQALLLHYHWAAPYMGMAPNAHGTPVKWKSLLQLDGTPMEYSWKWNTATSEPDVRYGVEPIGQYAGTALDPLNQQAGREILHRLGNALPDVDLRWTSHFLATLFDHNNVLYAQESAAGAHLTTSILLSLEFLRSGPALKTYFVPRKLGQDGGIMPIEVWESSINQLDPYNNARAALLDFMANNDEGKLLEPFCLSVDNVDPSQARLKWYFNSPHTSFKSIRDVMTLGGRIETTPRLEAQFTDLWELITFITELPTNFPEDAELPPARQASPTTSNDSFADLPTLLSGVVYFFDVAPGKSLPDVKVYIPARNHGRNDLQVARGLTRWMEAHGRGKYCDRFLRMLEKLAEHRHLEEGLGLQTFVSCQFKRNGDLDITSYLAPDAFHPSRQGHRRATRRRGD